MGTMATPYSQNPLDDVSPADKIATFDLTTLDDKALTDYRQELYQAIMNRGSEFEWFDRSLGEDWYRARLQSVDDELQARGLGPKGQGLP
jgi:hypothetical protein